MFFLLFPFMAFCQKQITVRGQFASDSMLLGEEIRFSLSCRHYAGIEVVFPDKNYSFGNFTFADKLYYPSKTNNNITLDSAVYTLRSFNIDSIQKLSLPVFINNGQGKQAIYSNTDSVIFINEKTENSKIDTRIRVLPMQYSTNYWDVVLRLCIVLFLIFIWWQIFGDIVRRQIATIFLNRQHRIFKEKFENMMLTNNKTEVIEAIKIWKSQIFKYSGADLSTLTSSEIAHILSQPALVEALGEIDMLIYGGNININLKHATEQLLQVEQVYYQNKKQMYTKPKSL
jgi:uncharacterized membrane protein